MILKRYSKDAIHVLDHLTSVASSHVLACFCLHPVEVAAITTKPMFAVLRHALLFEKSCHHCATTAPLRLDATNYSFKLSFRLLCTLQVVIVAEITKHTQVPIPWRCIVVDNTSRGLVVPSSRYCFILAPRQICGIFLIAFHLGEIFD